MDVVVVVVVVVFRQSDFPPVLYFEIVSTKMSSQVPENGPSRGSFQPTKPTPGEPAAEFGWTRIIIKAAAIVFLLLLLSLNPSAACHRNRFCVSR